MALFTRLMVNQIQKTFGTDINLSFEIASKFKIVYDIWKERFNHNNRWAKQSLYYYSSQH